jgi:TP901 family phage tail tape measure protein
MGSIFIDNEKANKSIDQTAKKGEDVVKALGSMVGTAAKWGAGLAAGATVAVAGMFALANKTSEAASAINDMSARTGISTKTLQELKFASDQAGVNFETVTGAVGKLTKVMSGAEEGGDKLKEAFDKLNIKTSDASGNMRKMDDIFPEVLKKLAGMKNETERNALAMTFFGKGAMELVPLLAQGEDGIKALTDKAHELGLVMSDEAIAANDEFGDTLDAVKASLGAVGAQIGTAVLPVFQEFLQWVLSGIPQVRELAKTFISWGDGVISNVKPKIADLVAFVKTELLPRFESIANTVKDIYLTYFPNLGTSTGGLKDTLRDMVTTALDLVISGLEWIRDNSEFVTAAVETITKAFLAYQVALVLVAAATNIYTIAQNIQKGAMLVYNGIMVIATAAQWGYLIAVESGSVALGVIAAAQWVFNAAMSANPIALVVLALAGLGLAIYEVVKHWKDICEWAGKAFDAVKRFLGIQDEQNNKPKMTAPDLGYQEGDSRLHQNQANRVMSQDENRPTRPGANANGTDNWRGGLTWVNEQGGEIMDLPRGTRIIPHDVSMEMAKQTANSQKDRPIIIYNMLDGKVISRVLLNQSNLSGRSAGAY